jgi:hypothetical protein
VPDRIKPKSMVSRRDAGAQRKARTKEGVSRNGKSKRHDLRLAEEPNPWPRPIPDIVHEQLLRPTPIRAPDYPKGYRARAGRSRKYETEDLAQRRRGAGKGKNKRMCLTQRRDARKGRQRTSTDLGVSPLSGKTVKRFGSILNNIIEVNHGRIFH